MDNQNEIPDETRDSSLAESAGFDYSVVANPVRIAVYDDGHSIPRMVVVPPARTAEFIESLAQTVYHEARNAGGSLPYTVIREVSENFIHARFAEATVSILDRGNTVRFTDQGPGIPDKDRAQQPGFTRAIEPMKQYIRGVGSGLPIVREYMELSHGYVTIEDNLGTGSVVTVSLAGRQEEPPAAPASFPGSPQAYPGSTGRMGAVEGRQDEFSGYPVSAADRMSSAYGNVPAGQHPYVPTQDPYAQARQLQHSFGMSPAPVPAQMPSSGSYAERAVSDGFAAGYRGYEPAVAPSPSSPAQGSYTEYPQRTVFPGSISVSVPDLSARELDVLALLYRNGPLRTKDLSEQLHLAGSSVNAAFTKLESKGLVQKLEDKSRVLTEIGRHIASTAV